MVSVSSHAESSTHNEAATYRAFIAVLTSEDKVTLPLHTARQAVSHFLAMRPLSDLKVLVTTSLAADIWSSDDAEPICLVKTAFTDAASLKESREMQESGSSVLSGFTVRRSLRRWFDRVDEALHQSSKQGLVLAARSGLLAGTSRFKDSVPAARRKVEDEMVIRLGDALEAPGPPSDQSTTGVAEAVIELPPWKVQLLADMGLRNILLQAFEPAESLDSPESSRMSHSPRWDTIGRALAHSFRTSASQPSRKGKERAWVDMETFAARSLSTASRCQRGDDAMSFLKFTLEVGNVVIDEIAMTRPPTDSQPKRLPLGICRDLLLALGALQFIGTPENPLRAVPGHEEVLYGCLDVIVATASEPELFAILDAIGVLRQQGGTAAFRLLVTEQFIPSLSLAGVRDRVVPLCRSQLADPSDVEALAAAHSVVLAILARCPQLVREATSRAWARSTVNWYAPQVIEHTIQGHLTAEQSKVAYKAVAQVAATLDDSFPVTCLDLLIDKLRLLEATKDSSATSSMQYLRLDVIGCLPYMPPSALLHVLNGVIKPMVISLPVASADRSVLCQALYDEIGGGLGDQAKIVGYRFWLEWRDRLVGEKAKL